MPVDPIFLPDTRSYRPSAQAPPQLLSVQHQRAVAVRYQARVWVTPAWVRQAPSGAVDQRNVSSGHPVGW